MLNHSDSQQEQAVVFLPCETPFQAMAAGRAAGEQWRGKPIAVAREQGPRATLFSVSAVAGLLAAGARVLDYGTRIQGEFHTIRDPRCPVAFYFRETPVPKLEAYAPGGQALGETAASRLAALALARQNDLPPVGTPGEWLWKQGGRDDYFQKLTALAPDGLEGVCCRFSSPDRETRALGNQVLSALGARGIGTKTLVLNRLGRLAALREDSEAAMEWPEIEKLLRRAEEEREALGAPRRDSCLAWRQDGLMAGVMLLDLLARGKAAGRVPSPNGTLVGIPILTAEIHRRILS